MLEIFWKGLYPVLLILAVGLKDTPPINLHEMSFLRSIQFASTVTLM